MSFSGVHSYAYKSFTVCVRIKMWRIIRGMDPPHYGVLGHGNLSVGNHNPMVSRDS